MIYIEDFELKEGKVDSIVTNMMGMEMPNYKVELTNS
jgi:hypothetical protein